MDLGAFCKLYKTCKICRQTQSIWSFSTVGGAKRPGARRSYCFSCYDRRHERKIASLEYSYDSVLLSEPIIEVRARTSTYKKISYTVSLEIAKTLVDEGAAGIVHETLLHRFYNRNELRSFVFERDNYTCWYCGDYGDTLDHIIPRSRGGLSTPKKLCLCM